MMTCASTRSVGRVGPSVTLAPGITPAQWRLMRQALVWNQLHIQKVFYHPQHLALRRAPRSLNGESAAGLTLAKTCPI